MNTRSDGDVSRRSALQIGLVGLTGLALSKSAMGDEGQAKRDAKQRPSSKTEPTAERASDGWIDAHVHVWTSDVERYPLAKGFTPENMKPPSFTPEQLFAHARPCGVERIVLIQMSFYGFDNRYMLDTMSRFQGMFSGVAVIDAQAAMPEATMRELAKHGVRGFRICPEEQKVEDWISGQGMARMWKCGGEEGLAMCPLINPAALPAIDEMCKKFPHTPVVIDHFARVGVDGIIREQDVENLCRLARHKHTHVKVSAFYALGKKTPPYTELGPMIRRLREAFGPERLMWASDSPFQVDPGHNYRDSIELIRSRLDFLSATDRQWMLRKTAERVFFS